MQQHVTAPQQRNFNRAQVQPANAGQGQQPPRPATGPPTAGNG